MSPLRAALEKDQAEVSRRLAELAALADDPVRQRAAAEQLIGKDKHLAVAQAASDVLERLADARSRDPLRARYAWLDANGEQRDAGGYIRAAILRALRPIARRDDGALATRAMTTVEMSGPFEVTADVRARGLLLMREADRALARYWACRLLADDGAFSGEPASTAIRLLAADGLTEPVYGVAVTGGNPEVVAAALRELTGLPRGLVDGLVERYRETEHELILGSLYDLIISREDRDDFTAVFEAFLNAPSHPALYDAVVTQLVASRSGRLIGLLREQAAREPDPLRHRSLTRALELA